jgi:hypothetical protein
MDFKRYIEKKEAGNVEIWVEDNQVMVCETSFDPNTGKKIVSAPQAINPLSVKEYRDNIAAELRQVDALYTDLMKATPKKKNK